MRALLLRFLTVVAILLLPRWAHAFCGFYVDGSGATLVNDATQVVLMRDGTRTAMSMQNDYRGPPEDFALVIPVPVVLQKENVKTLAKDVFARVERLSSPRLVEYWEQDPCPKRGGLGEIGTLGHGAGGGAGFGNGHGRLGGAHEVTVEAEFEVGEYEIVILSAQDSSGLDAWLREHGYKIPANADKALAPYVAAGSKFFVAKVNVTKVKMENGRASLSPLRFHYDSERFELPVKLGLLNSAGTQDLVVYVIANDRYEVANAPNVTIPTNLDVAETARKSFGAFYAALFDDTVAKHPGAVVTEYAWQTSNCDPCPGNASGLSPSDLASLGADALPGIWWSGIGARGGGGVTMRPGKATVDGNMPPEVVQRIVRQNFGRFRLCYESGLRNNPALGGRVTVSFAIDPKGDVVDAADAGSQLKDEGVVSCIVRGFGNLSFPEPEDKKKVRVTYAIDLSNGSAGGPPAPAELPKGPVILTRLHMRYGKDALGSDLVFRVAPPIVGGREDANGKRDASAHPTTGASNFQARYAIRHAWTGPVACDDPRRGVWGGPWPDAGVAEPGTEVATSLAYAPRGGGITLASFMGGAAPDVAPMPDASTPLATDAGAATEAPRARCGCRAVGSGRASGGILALAALAALAARRARAKPKTIDDYLAKQPDDRRAALEKLRRTIHALVPDVEECIRYAMPAFRVGGRVVAGFQATSRGCSYYPFSGRTLATLAEDLTGYDQTKSALHFDARHPLPKALVRKLLAARLAE